MAVNRVCVFCGARDGFKPSYRAAARALGAELARRGLELVYGGAAVGLMGAVADAVLEGGGRVTGVLPRGLARKEFAHPDVDDLRYVSTMSERKALMEQLSDAFVALPGGYGTLDELFEVTTWAQLGLHQKPIGVLNTDGFFDPLLSWVSRAVSDGFIPEGLQNALAVERDPGALIELLQVHLPPPPAVQWIKEGET